jgi:hypothetical protein
MYSSNLKRGGKQRAQGVASDGLTRNMAKAN